MSLTRWIKTDKPLQSNKGTYKVFDGMEQEILQAYSDMYMVKDILGFIPISVWYTKKGHWRTLLDEYRKGFKNIPTKKRKGVTIGKDGKVHETGGLPTSIRNPMIDERVYKFFGKPGYLVRNVFFDYGIEFIVAAQLGMNYKGSTVNQPLIDYANKFLDTHRNLIPDGISVDIFFADATDLPDDTNSVDLIWSSPPYWDIEVYPSDHPNEMSHTATYDEFLELYKASAKEIYRILRPGRYAVIQVADFRKGGVLYDLHGDTIKAFKEAGFKYHDLIIMVNISPHLTRNLNSVMKRKYTLKTHEYLLVFEKR